jgi:hypothetical protein
VRHDDVGGIGPQCGSQVPQGPWVQTGAAQPPGRYREGLVRHEAAAA